LGLAKLRDIWLDRAVIGPFNRKASRSAGTCIHEYGRSSQDLRGRLFAEWDAKHEESCANRADLGTNDSRRQNRLIRDEAAQKII
jgi:hypothetical protein